MLATAMATLLVAMATATTAADAELRAAEYFASRLTPRTTKYMSKNLTAKQRLYLCLREEEAFYGGAAGGGKSQVLLDGALQYVDQPGYAALILRRTVTDLKLPGALLDRAHQHLGGTDARWVHSLNGFLFPSGAKLVFGYLENENDKHRYASSEFQYVAFDELTQFSDTQYKFLFSRLRKLTGVTIPLRMRAASNPGGVGHLWVKQHFKLDPKDKRTAADPPFLPARLEDNPFIDRESYIKSLSHLDPITLRRLLNGDWTATDGGCIFDRSSWRFISAVPQNILARVRFWDLAATIGPDSKRTAGVRMSKTFEGRYVVENCIADKWLPGQRDQAIINTAKTDGRRTRVLIEEEPGSGGIVQNAAIIKRLAGYIAESHKETGDKFVRAGAFASQVQAGNVDIVEGEWNEDYIEELYAAEPGAKYLDRMDGSSGAFNWLAEHARVLEPIEIAASDRPHHFEDNYPSRDNPLKEWS
jgi:predicted phage terminase large subunit-like protein